MDNTVKDFNEALLKLHGSIEAMKKDDKNPFYNSSYIPLPKMLRTLKPTFQEHGFILSQPVKVVDGVNVVTSKLTHAKTGLSETSEIALLPEVLPKADMQKLGGAITYGRRYGLSALLGLEESDDDGNAASGKASTKKASTKSSKPASTGFRKKKSTSSKSTSSAGDDW
jgi:hypothetical protein